MSARPSRILKLLRENQLPTVLKVNLSEPRVIEIAGLCGVDGVWLCTEHVPNDWIGLENQIRAACLHNIDALVRVGGYRHPSLGEDLDMAVRLHRVYREAGEDYRIIQVPDAICWTEFPFNRTVLRRQRIRWHRGLGQVLRDHRRVILNPHYGRFGMLGMANMFVFEWVAALVEAAGYAICVLLAVTGNLNAPAALAFLACSQVVGLYLSVTAVRSATRFLDVYQGWRNAVRLLGWAVCMQFGYRQLTLLWRVRSLLSKNTTWGAMPRAGF